MLQQFRRAIGVGIEFGDKRATYFICYREVKTALLITSENRRKPSQSGRASWYSQHVSEGYGTFEQFGNGYDAQIEVHR